MSRKKEEPSVVVRIPVGMKHVVDDMKAEYKRNSGNTPAVSAEVVTENKNTPLADTACNL